MPLAIGRLLVLHAYGPWVCKTKIELDLCLGCNRLRSIAVGVDPTAMIVVCMVILMCRPTCGSPYLAFSQESKQQGTNYCSMIMWTDLFFI